MLPTSKRRFKPTQISRIALLCFCVMVLLAVAPVNKTTSTASETTAQYIRTQFAAVTPTDPMDVKARQELAVGDARRTTWTAASLREAIDHYEKAALLWASISDFRNASIASQKAGDSYLVLSEYGPALKQYTEAEALAQKSVDWLAQATALSQMGRLESYLGRNDLAQKHLSQSLALFKRHESNRTADVTNAYGDALGNLAEFSSSRGDFLNASNQLDSALEKFQQDSEGEARVRLFKGYIAGTIGDTNEALTELERALRLYREANDKSGEGLVLTAIGLWHSFNQNYTRAIALHNEALTIFRAIGDQHSEAVALNAIGQSYEDLKEHSSALAYFNNALKRFEDTGTSDAVAGTTCSIAAAQLLSGKGDLALASYERCLQLSRTAGNVRFQTVALEGIASAYGAQGNQQLALQQYQNSERFFQSIGDLRGQALALNSHGYFLLQQGEKRKARDVFNQAYLLTEKMPDRETLISTLYNLARANEALGDHEAALSLVEKSFNLIEEIRANVESPDFRASYFSAVKKHYDLCIEVLMQLNELRPREGFAAKAFSVSEQGRARLLLDLLSESRPNIREGAARELIEQEIRLRGLLRAQARYQMSLSLGGKDPNELTAAVDQVAQLRAEYQTVLAQLRRQNPRLFSFEEFAPVDLERIQKELQGTDTMLLEYALGDEHSYLWAVTSESATSYVLPARNVIEDAAGEFYKLITARQESAQNDRAYQTNVAAADNAYLEVGGKLSRMLLEPVIEKLGTRRLIFVTDGALQDIPFEALPVQFAKPAGLADGSPGFLITKNELVTLPSASTLIAIRNKQTHNRLPGKLVAIIADPVLNASDNRIQPATANAAADQNTDQTEQQIVKNLNLARLTHASEEADAISKVAPWGTSLVAKGFDASRETAMSPEVSGAQIVHFATHGFLNSEHPELSGMVLTMKDRNGANINGLMSLPDIYSLDLSAELTVLSACQTALGKDVKGEGLVGLTHSFMSAGAKSVVASLWKVDDRATAVLMADFYDGMLRKGMTPAAALRSAKLKMMSEKQWSAPYYWAGFVLQGEYANHIAVDRHSWLRPGLIVLFLLILIAVAVLVLQKQRRFRPA
jgi:CHAT domain-containing protein/tetratricopeptide (TPR) repeat protein